MLRQLHLFISRLSLRQIMLAGLAVRILAVIFSGGYGFHDDHFETSELAWKWQDGIPFTWDGSPVHMFSLLYPGLHYLIFSVCHLLGIHRPEDMMLVVRAVHAAASMGAIYYAWKLSFRLGNDHTTANLVALLIALGWVFPYLSVRSLREVFCIPFLLAGCYHAVAAIQTKKNILLTAFCFILAYDIRMQTIFIPFAIGTWWLFHRATHKQALLFGFVFVAGVFLTQGLFDWIHYGNPLASSLAYIRYNADPAHISRFPQGPWYKYIGTFAGLSLGIPALFLFPGFVFSYRISPAVKMILSGFLLFFIFHSLYHNKQERFIIPILPLFILLGIHGIKPFMHTLRETAWLNPALQFSVIWLLVLNTTALAVLTCSFSKKARVSSMIWLREQHDVTNIVMEGNGATPPPPLFYLQKHLTWYVQQASDLTEKLMAAIRKGDQPPPDYVIMAGSMDLQKREMQMRKVFPGLHLVHRSDPGFVDDLAWRLNPKFNPNEAWYIYKIR
jgi:hypothetical protein